MKLCNERKEVRHFDTLLEDKVTQGEGDRELNVSIESKKISNFLFKFSKWVTGQV